jgi:hypothetical protein
MEGNLQVTKEGVSIVITLGWRLSDFSFHDLRDGVSARWWRMVVTQLYT